MKILNDYQSSMITSRNQSQNNTIKKALTTVRSLNSSVEGKTERYLSRNIKAIINQLSNNRLND